MSGPTSTRTVSIFLIGTLLLRLHWKGAYLGIGTFTNSLRSAPVNWALVTAPFSASLYLPAPVLLGLHGGYLGVGAVLDGLGGGGGSFLHPVVSEDVDQRHEVDLFPG